LNVNVKLGVNKMKKRQLSAIMFTDLEGYTAMMQEDETNAKRIRDEHREILEREIKEHDGQVLQYYGDGALSIFNSTISASDSAISIQRASTASSIPLRIGIHSGDVVIEDDGVYGDGVNIASRIESLSVPGSVMISDKVYDDIKNHQKFEPALMGEFELKNIKKPIEVYALTNEGLTVPHRTDLHGKVKERAKSVVVIPFINRSSDPEIEHFSDGLTEELIMALSKVHGLKVISRATTFSLKGKTIDVKAIGKEFQIQSILDGSIRKSGNRIRINVQLASTHDAYELWTESFERAVGNVFELQDELTQAILHSLKEKKVLPSLPKMEKASDKISQEAYDFYLKGQFYYNKWTPTNAEKALDEFQKAIDLEPKYSDAYAGQALSYILMASTGHINPTEGSKLSIEAANRALSINESNEDALASLSVIDYLLEWDFEEGDKKIKRALEINPKSAQAHLASSLYYLIGGDLKNALISLNTARKIDPLSVMINRTMADAYYFSEDYKMAIEIYDWILEKDPDFITAQEFKAWAYLMNGDHDMAIELFESIQGDIVYAIKPFVQLGYAYALKGEMEKAHSYLEKLKVEAKANPEGFHDYDFATLYTGMNMKDEAFFHLRKCVDLRISPMVFLHVSPIWKSLISDPRFNNLLDEIGITNHLKSKSKILG